MITMPPRAYSMSRKKVGPPAAESGRNVRRFGKYVLVAAGGMLLGYGLYR